MATAAWLDISTIGVFALFLGGETPHCSGTICTDDCVCESPCGGTQGYPWKCSFMFTHKYTFTSKKARSWIPQRCTPSSISCRWIGASPATKTCDDADRDFKVSEWQRRPFRTCKVLRLT
ncbi:uncharacterized protein EI90DRAFT_3042674 [Cantharellus anzutake]|uniref:uncharacterized protein n=1 Tax=Cantharellus anzutake TaxID=1750568 RepID=UPI0019056EA2|nr:uncharacterized protein EI90DRAFT_3042674 [Cantharellus anzutake]KAF8337356.1 hypothetical protein EI90DRAFT_3042674 [Cantharellus anzutake]